MSKGWNHAMCYACWYKSRGEDPAHRVKNSHVEYCCYCGIPTRSGIWVRGDPQHTPCQGKHPFNPAQEEMVQ